VQHVAVCHNVLQSVAVWCSVLQCVAVCCSVLEWAAVCPGVLQCVNKMCCTAFLIYKRLVGGREITETKTTVSIRKGNKKRRWTTGVGMRATICTNTYSRTAYIYTHKSHRLYSRSTTVVGIWVTNCIHTYSRTVYLRIPIHFHDFCIYSYSQNSIEDRPPLLVYESRATYLHFHELHTYMYTHILAICIHLYLQNSPTLLKMKHRCWCMSHELHTYVSTNEYIHELHAFIFTKVTNSKSTAIFVVWATNCIHTYSQTVYTYIRKLHTFKITKVTTVDVCAGFEDQLSWSCCTDQGSSTFYGVAVCCSVLQCVAVCCTVLRCVALCCTVLHCVALCCTVLHCVAACCIVLHCAAVCCSVLQCVAVGCSGL